MKTRLDRWRAKPFGRLAEHFYHGIFRSTADSGGADSELSISGLLALIAVPGAFISLSLFGKYSSLLRFIKGEKAFDVYLASIPDKYFFIVFSMVATGIVAVLKWDRILPGRADYFNFAAMPFPVHHIFLANLMAIMGVVALFAVDVNAASAILFPLVVTADPGTGASFLSFAAAHTVSVILSSLFVFFAFFAVTGTMMLLLPSRLFRKLSLWLRVAALLACFTLLTTSFAVLPLVRRDDPLAAWLPPVWFLGLYQTLQSRASPQLAALGTFALQATLGAFLAAMAVYAASYRRYFLRIPETLDASPNAGRGRTHSALSRWLTRRFLRSDFQRACYHFCLKALLRSETHCLFFGGFVALGVVVAAQRALRAADTGKLETWLSLSFILAYCVIAGLRLVMEMPVGLRANMVFRSGLDPHAHEVGTVARKLMWTFLIPGVLLPSFAAAAWALGTRTGALHLAAVTTACWLLLELLLLRFRKIPFTCSMPGFQNHIIMLFFLYLLGFVGFALMLPSLETAMLSRPLSFAMLPAAAAAAGYFVREAQRDEDHDRHLIYEDRPEAAVTVLRIAE